MSKDFILIKDASGDSLIRRCDLVDAIRKKGETETKITLIVDQDGNRRSFLVSVTPEEIYNELDY